MAGLRYLKHAFGESDKSVAQKWAENLNRPVVRTTRGDPAAPCPMDRVNRQFHAERPNQLWVSD